MIKTGINQEALIGTFSQVTAQQGAELRAAVGEVTLKALQGRELTLENIREVLKTVTRAASTGAAQNAGPGIDPEALLGQAVAGMDAALLKTVEANRKVLQQFVDQGVDLQENQLKGALADLEKMEELFFTTVTKEARTAGQPLQDSWDQVLKTRQLQGSATGAHAASSVEQLMAQARTVRDCRAASLRGAQALMDGYPALVSGVLMGMSEGLAQQAPASEDASGSRKK